MSLHEPAAAGLRPPSRRAPYRLRRGGDRVARDARGRVRGRGRERDRDRRLPAPNSTASRARACGASRSPRPMAARACPSPPWPRSSPSSRPPIPRSARSRRTISRRSTSIRVTASEEQKRLWFGRVLQGYRLGNAFSEARAGMSATSETTARAGRRRLSWSTARSSTPRARCSPISSISARVDEEGQVHLAIAERGAPGLTIIDDWSSFGQRTTASGNVEIDNVRVGPEAVIPAYRGRRAALVERLRVADHPGRRRCSASRAAPSTRRSASCARESRPWIDSGQEHAHEDVFTIRRDRRPRGAAACRRGPAGAGRPRDRRASCDRPSDAALADATVAVAEAKVLTTEIAILATNKLHELGGTRSTLGRHNLDRHWRNARTHTLHDPVRWKYFHIGNHAAERRSRRPATPGAEAVIVRPLSAMSRHERRLIPPRSDARLRRAPPLAQPRRPASSATMPRPWRWRARSRPTSPQGAARARPRAHPARRRTRPALGCGPLRHHGAEGLWRRRASGPARWRASSRCWRAPTARSARSRRTTSSCWRRCGSQGSEEQKRFFYGRVLAGERIFNALSEKGTKTAQDHATRLSRRRGDGYRLNGRKFYSTGVLFAHWIAVVANDDDGRSTLAFVPRDTPGHHGGRRLDAASASAPRDRARPSSTMSPVHPFSVIPLQGAVRAADRDGAVRADHACRGRAGHRRGGAGRDGPLRAHHEPARGRTAASIAASLDPYVIATVGEMKIRTDASGALLDRAGRFVDAAQAEPDERHRGGRLGRGRRSQGRHDRGGAVRRLQADRARRVERHPAASTGSTASGATPAPIRCTTRYAGNTRFIGDYWLNGINAAAPRRDLSRCTVRGPPVRIGCERDRRIGRRCPPCLRRPGYRDHPALLQRTPVGGRGAGRRAMARCEKIRLNAFEMNCVAHQSPGLWRTRATARATTAA